jgi:hypothetical protein
MIQLLKERMTRIRFGYSEIGDWELFGACLPAGRQGIWLLGFSARRSTTY